MKEFVKTLQAEVRQKMGRIERSDLPTIKKAFEGIRVYAGAFNRLKEFVMSDYTFNSEADEIEFFREIKPRIIYRLIFYRKIYNIEMNRPVADREQQKEYLRGQLCHIEEFNRNRLDFVRYYRSGLTHLDRTYFLRSADGSEQYLETFRHEFDPDFSTEGDFNVATILANDLLCQYLETEIEQLERVHRPGAPAPFPEVRLTWQDSKTDLIELIYGLDTKGCFGSVPLVHLAAYLFAVFNMQPEANISRIFEDMKIRRNPTSFLDEVKEKLLQRMQRMSKKKA